MIPTTRALFSDSRPVGFSSVNSSLPQTNPTSNNHARSAANYSPVHQNHPGSQNPTNNHLNVVGSYRGLNNFNAAWGKQSGSGQIQSSFLVSPCCNADTLSSPVSNLFDRMNQSSVSNSFSPNDLSTKSFGAGGDVRHSPIQTPYRPLAGLVASLHSGSSQSDLFRCDKGQVSATSKGVPETPQLSDYGSVGTCQSLHTVAPRHQWRFPDKSLKIQVVESGSSKDTNLHTLSSPSYGYGYGSGKASTGSSYSKIVSALDLDSGIDQDFTESEEPLPCDRKTEQVSSWNGSKSPSYGSTSLPQLQNTRDVRFTKDAAPNESSEVMTSEFANKTFQYPSGDGGTGSLPCRVKNQTLVMVQKPVGPTEALGSSGRLEASNPLTSFKFQRTSSEAARRTEERPTGIGSALQSRHNSSELPAYDGPRLISMEKIRDNLDTGSLPHSTADANDKTNACRLARRLYELDGFRKSDVAKHLGKRSDFAQLVRQAYLQQFDFSSLTLDVALRHFLTHLVLSGETQERERILAEFSRRFVECNPHIFGSQDSCHMLVCGIMLLNTDLHGESDMKKMTVPEFVENLSGLNGGANFPKDLLKSIYNSIKNQPIEFVTDEADDNPAFTKDKLLVQSQANPFLDVPDPTKAHEFKTGYLMRKCCLESDGRRMPLGKRGWKMFYASLRDLVLYLHKDEHGFSSGATFDDTSNAVRVHHSLAVDASDDYAKRQFVFRVRAADWSEYMFQASNGHDCQEWIDVINQVAAALSAPPLPGAVGSQMKFQRPLMPATRTKLSLKDQLAQHRQTLAQTEKDLAEHQEFCPEKGSRQRVIQDYVEKEAYLEFEKSRFQTYCTAIEKLISSNADPNKSLTNDGYFQRTKSSQASGQVPRKLKDGSECFEADGEKRNLLPGMAPAAASVSHHLGHYPAKSVPVLLFESRV